MTEQENIGDKFAPIKSRINQFVENQKIRKEKFYQKTGISASNFKGKGAKSEIGGDKIVEILTIFPIINAEWLLTGKGDMIKATPHIPSETTHLSAKGIYEYLQAQEDTINHLKQTVTTLTKQLEALTIPKNKT